MRQESEDEQEYSQEEIKLMQLRERQSQHRKDLELLTSEDCPKKHPFDFGPRELADIKKVFPHGPGQQGLLLRDLRSHF